MALYPRDEIKGLPDPLVFQNGEPVKSAEEWTGKRRAELLKLFREEIYGYPPQIDLQNVSARHVYTQDNMLNGRALRKTIEICVKGNGHEHSYCVNLFLPKGKGPYPVLLLFNIMGIWDALATREEVAPAWPVEQIIGTISAWAWGVSRIMDCFVLDPDVDETRVAVIGFSRGGKTALWTSAQDERFALTVSLSSGCTGAAIIRGKTGEQIYQINGRFPYWFCDNYRKYDHAPERLPVDQHMLLSLIAPRPLYVISKTFDDWADPQREFDSAAEASKVYEFLGAKGVGSREMPLPDSPLQLGNVAYHIQTGAHDVTLYDWLMIMDYADKTMRA